MPARKKNTLLEGSQAIEVPEGGPSGNTQETTRITVPASKLEDFADLVLKTHPDAYVHEATIAKGGRNAAGKPNVLFSVKQDEPTGMATVWASGKGSLTGAMADLPW